MLRMSDLIQSSLATWGFARRGAVSQGRISKPRFVSWGAALVALGQAAVLPAAVVPLPDFTASNESVLTGSALSVHITTTNFVDLSGFSFTLSWDTAVLTINPTTPVSSLAPAISAGAGFDATTFPGQLTFLWSTGGSVDLPDNTLLFDINFTAIGAAGTFSGVAFGDSPTPRGVTDDLAAEDVPTTVDGQVTVVPEPVNLALGLFGCGVAAFGGIRWGHSQRRAHSTRTR